MRQAAETICPQARRRARRSSTAPLQVVREAAKANSSTMTASVRTTATQLRRAFVSTVEPPATAAQKKSVAAPKWSPPGTVKLESCQVSSAHVMGVVHCGFRLIPVGPL